MGMLTAIPEAFININAQQKELDYNRDEGYQNLATAQRASLDATERGNLEAGRARLQGSQMIARQKVAYANSGVDSTVGTAANVQADTRALTELDAKTIENNAAREAWGYKKQGEKFRKELDINRSRAESQMYGTILTTVGKLASGAMGADAAYDPGKKKKGAQ